MIRNKEIESLNLYAKDLNKIINKQKLKVKKEKDKQADKLKAIYAEYKTENDVMDAYACGGITESKKDKLLELFRNKDKVDNGESADGLYLNILKKDLKNIKIQIKHPRKFENVDIDPIENESKEEPIESGIPVSEKYIIDTLDELNVTVKEKYTTKPDEKGNTEEKWKVISYHPSMELAFKSIVNQEINISCAAGLDEVVKKIDDLKAFKKKIQG